ncbi:SDR family oxidoreductase [Chryseobacterium gleum]|uniref:SDR family oxidoreductase n=1 Tax=Chryseobacterium gleum TaxID=250 RepID=UPI0028AD91A0|nr:SDR family oxidoreductase [Chryseobacterium gleum]
MFQIDGSVENLTSELQSRFVTDKFDFLINNAGFMHHAEYENVTEEQFLEMENVHFKGPFFLTQKLLPQINNLEVL